MANGSAAYAIDRVCKAWLERDTAGLRTEFIQVAAVALAWVEELDNTGGASRAA